MSKREMKFLQEILQTVRNDLIDLKDYEETVVLKDLSDCFPQGYLTDEGYHSLFLQIYSRQRTFDSLLSQIDKYRLEEDMQGRDQLLLTFAAGEWFDKQAKLLFDFVIAHGADLKTASFDSIRQVVDRFCQPEFMDPKGLNFFLNLSNWLNERQESGELVPEDLSNRIMSLLLYYRQTRKRSRRIRG